MRYHPSYALRQRGRFTELATEIGEISERERARAREQLEYRYPYIFKSNH